MVGIAFNTLIDAIQKIEPMTRKLFIESILAIKKQYDHDNKCASAFKIILPNDRTLIGYDNHFVVNQIIRLLKVELNDNHKNSWIEYFIYELDFGKNNGNNSAFREDGSVIDLSDAGKLYDFLINN